MTEISYICPVYNKLKYLPIVLESIFNQKGKFKREYIFIDDGSSDGSYEFIKEYTKKIKNVVVLTQSNKGPASATQKGIEISKGNYIKLVGGDDVMAPFCTEILLETIKKTKTIAVFSKYREFKKKIEIKFNDKKIKNLRIICNPLYDTVKSNFSGTTPNLYCSNAIKRSGGCYKNLFVEDFSLVLRISSLGAFSFIDNITSFGPKNDETRIMLGNKNQLLHDYNAAIYYFIKENPSLSKNLKIMACLKCLGRSEKWLRREMNKTFFNIINLERMKYYIRKTNELSYIRKSCKIFYKNFSKTQKQIRYKIS